MTDDRIEMDLTHPDNHPILISVGKNEEMGAFDLDILVGNFKTEDAAREYADRVKEFLEEHAEASFIGRA